MKSNYKKAPLISVCITTYQHASFIGRCLDSILGQKTKFPFEIVLGDDDSNDGTREICIDYENRYPNIIRLFLRSRKNVIYINGRPTGRYNFVENIKAAKGKYIALCDGDDYWTDSGKLEEQVTFLESNLDFALCFTNIAQVDRDDHIIRESLLNYKTNVFTQETIVAKISPPTLTIVFRKEALPEMLPEDFFKVPNVDMFMKALISEHGKIKFINKITANKRQHEGGISAGVSSLQREEKKIITQKIMLAYFKSETVKKNLRQAICVSYARLMYHYFAKKNFKKAIKTFSESIGFYISQKQVPPFKIILAKLTKDNGND